MASNIQPTGLDWKNLPDKTTPISAENLNKMANTIDDLVEAVNPLNTVEANPEGTPTEGLEKVEIDGTLYEVKGGHKILNDSGTVLNQKDNLQFKGTYVEDDQTNNKTVVNVIRQMTLAEFNQLTAEQKKGIINVTDQQGHPITASDVPYDSNTSVKDKIDDVSNSATYTPSDEINLSDFVALGYLRGNRKRVDFVVPINKDLANSTLTLSGTWSLFDLSDNTTLINGEDINATGNTVTINKMNGYLLIQLTRADNITTSRMCGLYLGTGSKITIS